MFGKSVGCSEREEKTSSNLKRRSEKMKDIEWNNSGIPNKSVNIRITIITQKEAAVKKILPSHAILGENFINIIEQKFCVTCVCKQVNANKKC